MDRAELQAVQKPLKERYREEPAAALITLRADGELDEEQIACSVDTGPRARRGRPPPRDRRRPARSPAPATCCSRRSSPARASRSARSRPRWSSTSRGSVHAEGDLDFRGTLGVDREAPVGFTAIRLTLRARLGRDGGGARQADRADRALLRRLPDARRRRPRRVELLDLVGHQDRVDELAAAAVVALAVALALEAERLVEARSPPRSTGRRAARACGRRPRAPTPPPRAAAPSPRPAGARRRDHQADVGDVRARRVRVAPDREAADERPVAALRDEDRRVRIAAQRLEEAALIAGAPPLAGDADQPALGLSRSPRRRAASAARRPTGSACRIRTPSLDDYRSAAPPRVACRGERAVLADLDGRDAAEEEVPLAPADDRVARRLELVRGGRILAVGRCRPRHGSAAPRPPPPPRARARRRSPRPGGSRRGAGCCRRSRRRTAAGFPHQH